MPEKCGFIDLVKLLKENEYPLQEGEEIIKEQQLEMKFFTLLHFTAID